MTIVLHPQNFVLRSSGGLLDSRSTDPPTFTLAPTTASLPSSGGTIQFSAQNAASYGLTVTRTGITIDGNTGLVTVAGTAAGTSGNITVRATNQSGQSTDVVCAVTVAAVVVVTTGWPSQNVAAFQSSYSKLPVIPGVTAFGANQYGGSGRHPGMSGNTALLFVNSLSTGVSGTYDSGTRIGYGTLRWCLQQTMPRVVIPLVSGWIDFQSGNLRTECVVSNPYITYAGQCAPSPGLHWANLTLTSWVGAGDTGQKHHVFWHASAFWTLNSTAQGQSQYNPVGWYTLYANCTAMWGADESFTLGQSNSGEGNTFISLWQCATLESMGTDAFSYPSANPGTHGHCVFSDWNGVNVDIHRHVGLFNGIRSPHSRSPINVVNCLFGQTWETAVFDRYSGGDKNNVGIDVNMEGCLYVGWPAGWEQPYDAPILLQPLSGQYGWASGCRIWAATPSTSSDPYVNRLLNWGGPGSEANMFSGNVVGVQPARLTASWTPGAVPYSLVNGGDNRVAFSNLALDSCGSRPKDRLPVVQRPITAAKNRIAVNGQSYGSPPKNWSEVAALVPSVAQNSIANPFTGQAAWDGRAVPNATRNTVLTGGTFSDGYNRAGYTELDEFLYEVHLKVTR